MFAAFSEADLNPTKLSSQISTNWHCDCRYSPAHDWVPIGEDTMIRRIPTFVVAVATLVGLASLARAEQHPIQTPEGEKIVHTRLTPVLLHRAVPPYLGRHVYQGRLR
jgi:hypothetical protein